MYVTIFSETRPWMAIMSDWWMTVTSVVTVIPNSWVVAGIPHQIRQGGDDGTVGWSAARSVTPKFVGLGFLSEK